MSGRGLLPVRPGTVALAIATALLVVAEYPSARPVSPNAASYAECLAQANEMVETMKQWSTGGKRAVYDPKGFWDDLGPEANFQALARYVTLEDGVRKPIRTGREVALYDRIKEVIAATPVEAPVALSFGRVMQLALDASADETGRANISTAMLTAHNVVRALARPQQWTGPPLPGDYGHPPSDPMTPIFDDLQTLAPGTLPQLMNARGMNIRSRPDGSTSGDWATQLFGREHGIFATVRGARNAEWNGGSHYYFWIGALAKTHLGGGAVLWGIAKELDSKRAAGIEEQGIVEVSHFVCGSAFANRTFAERAGFMPGTALAVTSVSAPSSVISWGPRLDIDVSWSGDAVPPLTVTIRPRTGWTCEQGGCSTKILTFEDMDNPATMPGAAFCYGYDSTWLLQYEVVIRDGSGASTEYWPYPITYTCIVE